MRYGLSPESVNQMPLDLLEAYLFAKESNTITFSDEAALARYLANQAR